MRRTAMVMAALAAIFGGSAALAQDQASDPAVAGPPGDAPPPSAEQIAEQARQALKAPGTRQLCQAPKGNEIVVCAQDPSRLRVPSSTDEGTNTNDGVPRAPDVFGIPSGGIVIARGCFFPPCPRKMPPLIDLKAIPEAPPGSDAARFKDDADARERAAAAPAAAKN